MIEHRVTAEVAPERRRRPLGRVALYALSLSVAAILSVALVMIGGGSWPDLFGALLDGAFLAPGRWGRTLDTAAPLLLVAVGMVVGVRAGRFNIGQEGQLLIGALAMAAVGTRLNGPGPVLVVGGLCAGALAGGLYAGLAAEMRRRRQVPEVISTLLLVFVAVQMVGLALTTDGLLRDLDPDLPPRVVASEQLGQAVRLPVVRLFGNEFDLGIVIAVGAAVAVAFVLGRTAWGMRVRLFGLSETVARVVGVREGRTATMALMVSGALAGLAGSVMLLGGASSFRLTVGFSLQYGWQGLLVALLAGTRPLWCIPMAILFAALRTGAGFLASTGVDRTMVDAVAALLVLALLVPPAVLMARSRRGGS